MAAGNEEDELETGSESSESRGNGNGSTAENIAADGEEDEDEDEEPEDEEDEEPRLKYARLTGSIGGLYRNGDATSSFFVEGDKMIIGTHNGNIHVLSLPSLQSLRVYRLHSASVTAISISPFPLPIVQARQGPGNIFSQHPQSSPAALKPASLSSTIGAKVPKPLPLPATVSNSIHIGTASIDGNVCISSLIDPKDVMLRNFGRPVQAIALSPDFKNDRSYLSGGLAGNLVLTVGGRSGTSSTANITATSTSSSPGWLGSIGLASNNGKDTVLHSGEGPISTIKWSRSGKYVVWINEQGIKIMRSSLHLDSAESESAWKRISHIDRPDGPGWDEMSSVWKGRAEWIDEKNLESDDDTLVTGPRSNIIDIDRSAPMSSDPHRRKVEKLVVGWGGTVWVLNVHHGGLGVGRNVGERTAGRAEIAYLLRTDSYVVPGPENHGESISTHGKKDSISSVQDSPKRGIQHRKNALSPELRIINLATSEEISADTLAVSRFESLSAPDYHLGVLPPNYLSPKGQKQRGAFEGIGNGLWNAGLTAGSIFNSAASILSSESKSGSGISANLKKTPTAGSLSKESSRGGLLRDPHPALIVPGLKVFIQSPYDCVLATKRDLADHLVWLLSRKEYQESWQLIDDHPEVLSTAESPLPTPIRQDIRSPEFFRDDASITTASGSNAKYSAAEKEKRRVGELWIEQLIESGNWVKAGSVCGKVLDTHTRWEHWVWVFAEANKFSEITPYIPTTQLRPPLASLVYEVVLGHFIAHDRLKLRELLDRWQPELFDIRSVTEALEEKLKSGEVQEKAAQDGEEGRDWRILTEGLGKLLLADGRPREALKCYIQLKDADGAMMLIKNYHLLDAISDDIPGLIFLRVTKEQLQNASKSELELATAEPIRLLVDEAHHGAVRPEVVVQQLEENGHLLFLFFYLRALWKGDGSDSSTEPAKLHNRMGDEGKILVEGFADLAVRLFVEYDRPLLMEFLRSSQSYTFEKASEICEVRNYIPELVYLLSKTGQTKRALFLIIDRLHDVSQAISFAKSQDDPDLWNDLLDYSMDKPRFIRGLLEEVGTSINPITLVRRIPEGLEIEGLRDGLSRMIKEYEIQFSISEGVARVLRGEVAIGMDALRIGQKKAVKFDVINETPLSPVATVEPLGENEKVVQEVNSRKPPKTKMKSGHCMACMKPFGENVRETLVGFACGHIFHLSCLISKSHDPETPVADFEEFNVEVSQSSWSVGTKCQYK
ncbi:MAG: Vacuolar protein sorting-associated protein 41 [Trizodia sp. TS-e1964]|nr:MAG: Vacuolar protein sorting-associated protein 41 [Trizodia sp. TS-e1964]